MHRNVGVFCPTLNVCGGGEYVALAIANTLAKNNQNVILFTKNPVSPSTIKTFFGETLNSSILQVKQTSGLQSQGVAKFYQTILDSYVAKTKCDTFIDVFTNCVFPWTDISYIHYPYLNRTLFSPTFPYLQSPRFIQAGTVPQVFFEKNLVSYDDKLVLANSYYTATEIQRYSKKKATVLYPPFSSFISEIGKRTTKDRSDSLVVTVSRIEPTKLLERIPFIAAHTPTKVNYAIIGRLYNKQTLSHIERVSRKLGVTDRVKIYPDAPIQTKISLLQKAKIYLHTMIGEHFGISTVEAMALGCIPVVHNSGGMEETVPHQYRYNTVEEAIQTITWAIDNWTPEQSENFKQVADQFSLSNFSEKFLQLFSSYN